ncbi:MAG TPA: glycosyltransferase family 39 protein [Vicinamibacterales bacterium]|nr:glycosyltransferase family 39 protein [Vicinamibacterales bacterium]
MRLHPILTACVLAGITLLLYAFHVSAAPLTTDESVFNTQAQSVRAGTPPLFFHVRDEHWRQPLGVYANAAVRVVGGDDMSGRLVSVVVGAINVALVFLIAQAMTGRTIVAIFAAVVLMFTPAHWSIAQLGTDAIFPAPLVLLWLWNALRFVKLDRGLPIAAAALGLSVYSHPAGPLTALFLWLLTLIVARRRHPQPLIVSTLVFGLAWLPAVAWFYLHPADYPDTFGRWFVFAAHLRNPIDGLRAFFNVTTLGTRAALYWNFWDPSWLFFRDGDASPPLLMVAAPFIVIGLYRCARLASRESRALVIGSLAVVPIAGATFIVLHYMTDAASVLPILALVAGLGVDQLVAFATRRPLEDGVDVGAVEGWDSDHLMPRS